MVDGFWNYVEKKNNGFACKFCEFEFAARTSVTRIKSHLSGIKGLGVSICNRVPDDVKEAACLAIQGGKKRRKPMPSSSNDVLVPNPERDVVM